MTKYREISITPAHAGFGEYHCTSNSDAYDNVGDLHIEMSQGVADAGGELIELVDGAELPAGAEDIRGRIHGEPERVFVAAYEDGRIAYIGIDSIPE